MNAAEWGAIAFGSTLALVIGLRLSQDGMLIAAFLLLSLVALVGRWLSRWIERRLRRDTPAVVVERRASSGLWQGWKRPPCRGLSPSRVAAAGPTCRRPSPTPSSPRRATEGRGEPIDTQA